MICCAVQGAVGWEIRDGIHRQLRGHVWQYAVHMCYAALTGRNETVAIPQARNESTRPARLDVRLNPEAKEKIEQAAVVSHQTITDFVVTSLLRASEEALLRQHTIRLTDRDRDRFLAALDANTHPNQALRKAAERSRRRSR
jgi:uncharacterized protein (DUF1778 family)